MIMTNVYSCCIGLIAQTWLIELRSDLKISRLHVLRIKQKIPWEVQEGLSHQTEGQTKGSFGDNASIENDTSQKNSSEY